jgi:bifunctional UDP-N-acetylglucosamine pyrophosphorylase / glucosamine-1-phosphate N-acetyltransferase
MEPLGCIILAAGEGKRFRSKLPKPLHRVCGRAMVDHVIDSVAGLGCQEPVVVVGVGREQVEQHLHGRNVRIAVQAQQLGTGHAAASAEPLFVGFTGPVLVTCGDAPLVPPETLRALLGEHLQRGAAATVLTAIYEDPTGYGRIVRDEGGLVRAIVEHRDCTPEQRLIREINSSIYLFDCRLLFEALSRISPQNDQGEYYLSDVIATFVTAGRPVAAVVAEDPADIMGVNDRRQLALAESIARDRIRRRLMAEGVTLTDPPSIFVDAGVTVGRDTVIAPGVSILGDTAIGEDCVIEGQALIEDSRIGDGCRVQHGSIVRQSVLADRVTVGPYCHIRAQSRIGDDSRVGSYSEVVRTTLGRRCKDLHFGYLGDATLGDDINIGAGTVACNYDGREKSPTIIGDGAFIGSNSTLVAPLRVGAGAYIAAGSTITGDVPDEALGIGRSRQTNKDGYARKLREGS